jgi:RNA polymerase sigma factor (TIGR02999 family)
MSDKPARTVTRLLEAIHRGDDRAKEELGRVLCDELHAAAERALRRERPGHTLQPTDLVQEVFLRLLEGDVLAEAPNRAYLFGAASTALRRVLVDHARKRASQKHGGGWRRTPLDDVVDGYASRRINLLALHEALETLQSLHPRQRQIVDEHHFGGFTLREVAGHLGVSEATVYNDFQRAQVWLAAQIGLEK